MDKYEKSKIIQWANSLIDDELKNAYYDAAFACLGSEAEEMYERGYDVADILEREKYEKDLMVKADILEMICIQRGINLWGHEFWE